MSSSSPQGLASALFELRQEWLYIWNHELVPWIRQVLESVIVPVTVSMILTAITLQSYLWARKQPWFPFYDRREVAVNFHYQALSSALPKVDGAKTSAKRVKAFDETTKLLQHAQATDPSYIPALLSYVALHLYVPHFRNADIACQTLQQIKDNKSTQTTYQQEYQALTLDTNVLLSSSSSASMMLQDSLRRDEFLNPVYALSQKKAKRD